MAKTDFPKVKSLRDLFNFTNPLYSLILLLLIISIINLFSRWIFYTSLLSNYAKRDHSHN
jgi:hypothetical protein